MYTRPIASTSPSMNLPSEDTHEKKTFKRNDLPVDKGPKERRRIPLNLENRSGVTSLLSGAYNKLSNLVRNHHSSQGTQINGSERSNLPNHSAEVEILRAQILPLSSSGSSSERSSVVTVREAHPLLEAQQRAFGPAQAGHSSQSGVSYDTDSPPPQPLEPGTPLYDFRPTPISSIHRPSVTGNSQNAGSPVISMAQSGNQFHATENSQNEEPSQMVHTVLGDPGNLQKPVPQQGRNGIQQTTLQPGPSRTFNGASMMPGHAPSPGAFSAYNREGPQSSIASRPNADVPLPISQRVPSSAVSSEQPSNASSMPSPTGHVNGSVMAQPELKQRMDDFNSMSPLQPNLPPVPQHVPANSPFLAPGSLLTAGNLLEGHSAAVPGYQPLHRNGQTGNLEIHVPYNTRFGYSTHPSSGIAIFGSVGEQPPGVSPLGSQPAPVPNYMTLAQHLNQEFFPGASNGASVGQLANPGNAVTPPGNATLAPSPSDTVILTRF